jgi:hypothetical protein
MDELRAFGGSGAVARYCDEVPAIRSRALAVHPTFGRCGDDASSPRNPTAVEDNPLVGRSRRAVLGRSLERVVRAKLPLVLSALALAIALLGATPVGHAAATWSTTR